MQCLRLGSRSASRLPFLYESLVASDATTSQATIGSLISLTQARLPTSTTTNFQPQQQYYQQRQLFSIPGFTDDVTAQKYHEKKLLRYSPQQLFDVVTSVEDYHKFVPWCQGSKVLSHKGDTYLEAELEVGFQIFSERYISKVTLNPPHTVHSEVGNSTLFSHLKNKWEFQPGKHPNSTWVTFEVDFAFKSPLYSQVASLFLDEVVRRMVGAFEGRCRLLYGPSSLEKRRQQPVGSTVIGAASSTTTGGGDS